MSGRILSKNVPYLCGQVSAMLGNTSIFVKIICLVVFFCYFLSFSETAVITLSVTPGYFNPPHFWIWTALTHCFLEIHFWEVLVDIFTMLLVGKLIEPLWGALEMVTFFFIINSGVAVLCAIFYYILYMFTFNTQLLFDVHIHGLSGYLAGVSMAVKQIMPDLILFRTPLGKITNRNIPLLVFGLTFIMWAIGMVEGSYCTMFGTGLVISWTYLRFYQVHNNGTRGDMADSFAFATLFPNVVQPPLSILSNLIFSLAVKCRICRKPVRRYDVGAPTGITISIPGAESQDSERRRQIALRALSERLSKNDASGSQWPSMEEPEKSSSPTSISVESGSIPATPSPSPHGAPQPEQPAQKPAQESLI
ncbi:transmembrane protein 115 isoform X2 [Eurytemora carolleeae]|uniref:transmembrane protein 115 isoform X1 n=1 Tax=Eurytemora carolleeae TaxID=1294199 RepID=UPI000C775442|nr:transmembrane protein 115 isoform X1 [Eurytemora carolleeae]XP_023333705.1 transmembrane protein 115 isoform X1 [Eurytemora carolleeae]XP_023333706.1 transmembrane protein 115 isoform X1 [Eurytemora carolleeae]XP_023333707.1 transmembrane protein 115 isoform X2 [Eurytemora carolleeae]|eukprot:XP_023333704.1 transmembrane protein 115-like isoform X1 [Eurytemora affinis]